MESMRRVAEVRVVVTRLVREEGGGELESEEGEMSVAQERGERDLKGVWWAISLPLDAFPSLPSAFFRGAGWMGKNGRIVEMLVVGEVLRIIYFLVGRGGDKVVGCYAAPLLRWLSDGVAGGQRGVRVTQLRNGLRCGVMSTAGQTGSGEAFICVSALCEWSWI
jgi:hypothetical protein